MWGGNGLKWKFSLQTISGLTCKERERSHPKRDQTQSPEPFNLAPFDFAVRLRLRIAPFNFTGEPRAQIMPSSSLRSHPKIVPRRHRLHWDHNWEIVGFWWIWPGFLVGFCFCVYLLRNGIIYLFGSWENMRKCEEQKENVFSILFSAT